MSQAVSTRVDEELMLLRGWFGDRLEFRENGLWVVVRGYKIPSDLWIPSTVDVAFQVPAGIPGQAPYAFHVFPGVHLTSGAAVNNYAYPTSNVFGDGWGTFSWALDDWHPGARACDGSNMLTFARSFADRFTQGT